MNELREKFGPRPWLEPPTVDPNEWIWHVQEDELALVRDYPRPALLDELEALARKVDDAPRMPDDFVMRAIPKQMVEMADNDQGRKWLDNVAEASAKGVEDEDMQRLALG